MRDQLLGFARAIIDIQDAAFAAANGAAHAIVQFTGPVDDRVDGTVLELTDAELERADAYEPAGYRRVDAAFASGRRGWVYAEAAARPAAPR